MAKLNGFIGSGSGKVGTLVLSKGRAGQTIARAYQPQVKNPQTIAQQLQRSKMNLAGKIGYVVSSDALSALMMGNARLNRAEFSRVIMRNATAGMVGGSAQAQINPERLVFGRGAAPMLVTLSAPSFTKNSISLSVTASPGSYAGMYGVRIVILCVASASSPAVYQFSVHSDHVFAEPAEGQSSVTESIVLRTPDMATGNQCFIYVIPFVLSDRGLKAFGNEMNYDDSLLTASLSVNTGFVTDWGNSYYVGSVPFELG